MMTLDYATNHPIDAMPTADLWPAVKLIGAHKLFLRKPYDPARYPVHLSDQLRAYNVRIDTMLREETDRQNKRRGN